GRDRTRLMARLSTLPIQFVTSAKCSEIRDGVCFSKDGKDQSIKADTVVLAVGARPENALFPELKAKGFEVHLAGDCWHIGRIIDAMGDGMRLGCAV
ncbi:MAG: hypothetical protein Q7R57_03560, partial [Dehalococcoidales bacterium]|nr:hypothetical protein [Dehalococcoidales bacterium]